MALIVGNSTKNYLFGGGLEDTLRGLAGNDFLEGGGGGDLLDGGSGFDFASYELALSAVHVSLLNGSGTLGDALGDQFFSIEGLIGSAFDDTLLGDAHRNVLKGRAGNDTLLGNGGNDRLEGGSGSDLLNGNTGRDLAVYRESLLAVQVNLQTGVATGGDAQGDVLISIEGVIGSHHSDTLIGSDEANKLFGRLGDDTLIGGDGNDVLGGGNGADVLDGGAGNDWASYRGSISGVTVDLLSGAGQGGHAHGDQLTDIENLRGSGYGDMLAGDEGDNRLFGEAGDDILEGRGGNDLFIGGRGSDVFNGGEGTDTVTYWNSIGNVSVNTRNGQMLGEARGDSFISIENLVGTSNGDSLILGDGDNRIFGGAGNDFLDGGNGNDILVGGAGGDFLHGGPGIDTAAYWGSDAGVTVFTSGGLNTGGHAQGDTMSWIHNITGSRFDDAITGDILRNTLKGLDGDDVLTGRGDQDVLTGGAGADHFRFVDLADTSRTLLIGATPISDFGGSNGDIITDFEQGIDRLSFDASVFSGDVFNTSTVAELGFVDWMDTAFAFTDEKLFYVYYANEANFQIGNSTLTLIAEVQGVGALSSSDFEFI